MQAFYALDNESSRPVETYEFSKLENVLTVVVTALQWCDLWDRVE